MFVSPPPDPPGERAGNQLGRYKLLEKIGEGGMGSVWIAEQRQEIHRKVALKVIKLGMDTKQVIARFEAERQALALMDHPGIAKVLDAGSTDSGRPFFVMELVQGIPITDYCDRHQIPTAQRLALFIQVCKAVHHAHQKGIIHRDIKPQNILATVQDSTPAPKIIDFGIAKALAGQRLTDKTVHTQLEEFIGTPAYMSPEQAENTALAIDARADIYALGVLLYELLTGVTPFQAGLLAKMSTEEIRRVIREEEPPRPSTRLTTLAAAERKTLARRHHCEAPTLVHLVRGDLDWIVMKCLEKDRTRRYATAEDLAADVQRHLDNQPVIARPPSPLYRLSRFARRHRRPLTAAAAVLLLTPLAAILLAIIWPNAFHHKLSVEQRLQRVDKLLLSYDLEGHIPEALALLREASNHAPPSAQLWAARGWANWLAYCENEREESRWESQQCASNALSISPENPYGHFVEGLVANSRNDWTSATNHLFRAKELTRSANGLVPVALATSARALRDLTNAATYVQLAEKAAEERWDVWDRIGYYYYRARAQYRDLDRARSAFERAVSLAPNSPMAHRHYGDILLLQKLPKEALSQLESSLRLRRTPETLSAIGSAYLKMHEYTKAANYFLQASRADPERYNYHVNAGMAFRQTAAASARAQEQFNQALRQIDDQLAGGRENALLRSFRGFCLAALGRNDEARLDLEKAILDAGPDMTVRGNVINAFNLMGDKKRASELQNSGTDE